MTWQLNHLGNPQRPVALDPEHLDAAIDELVHRRRPHYRRLWAYYRNPLLPNAATGDSGGGSDRPYRQGQEWGLPSRITGVRAATDPDHPPQRVAQVSRKEVVVENDIAWRIDTGVDFLFGRPLLLESTAPDTQRREFLTTLFQAIFERHGGARFFQQLALLGSVHGFVDVLVKLDPKAANLPGQWSEQGLFHTPDQLPRKRAERQDWLARLAPLIHLEIVEPNRALPLRHPADGRVLQAYAQVYDLPVARPRPGTTSPGASPRRTPLLRRWFTSRSAAREAAAGAPQAVQVVELISASHWQRYENQTLMQQGINSLGEIPLVHIQNLAMPFEYSGTSDVEPLIPLQDELNTRLCDRAHRVTMQSFKMYLGKGIDDFLDQPIAPGRMWLAGRDDASVTEFGGDANCPSESAHIADIREALDKTSGITPLAAGVIKTRLGQVSSGVALRIISQATLNKTDRKRTAYGAALARLCELALGWLDCAGIFITRPQERGITLHWPSPLPENESEKLDQAAAKLRVGVPRQTVLAELGYTQVQSSGSADESILSEGGEQ